MDRRSLHPRFAESRLVEALSDTPVVLIHGPRQCGKTTLAHMVGDPRGYSYFSFDDQVAREAAQVDPVGFAGDLPERGILDEVQKVPVPGSTNMANVAHFVCELVMEAKTWADWKGRRPVVVNASSKST